MANPLDRTWYNTLVDDDGSGTTGTIWNKAAVDALLDSVDASLAPLVANPSTVDLTIDKTRARLVMHHTGALTKARVMAVVNDWAGLTMNADYDGAAWGKDDPAQDGLVLSVATAGLTLAKYPVGSSAGSPLFVVAKGGLVTIPGGQLQFPVVQIPSADPYTLDDYREPVWQATITGSGGGSGQAYGDRAGVMTKVGRLVTLSCRVNLITAGTMSGIVRVSGFPVAMGPSIAFVTSACFPQNLLSPIASAQLVVSSGQTYADVYYWPAGGGGTPLPMPVAFVGNSSEFIFTITYPSA